MISSGLVEATCRRWTYAFNRVAFPHSKSYAPPLQICALRPDQGPRQASERGERRSLVLSAFRAFTAQTGASGHPHTSFGVRVVVGPRGFTLTIPLLGLAIMARPDQGPRQVSERGGRQAFVLSAFRAFTATPARHLK